MRRRNGRDTCCAKCVRQNVNCPKAGCDRDYSTCKGMIVGNLLCLVCRSFRPRTRMSQVRTKMSH
jgi:hypothetical protein